MLRQRPAATIDALIMPLFAAIVVVDNVVVEDSNTGSKVVAAKLEHYSEQHTTCRGDTEKN